MIKEEAILGHISHYIYWGKCLIQHMHFASCKDWVELSETLPTQFWLVSVGVCQFFLGHSQIAAFEVKCKFWPVNWNWSGLRMNPYERWCGSDRGWSLGEGVNFSWRTKNLILSDRGNSLERTFCHSCVYFDFAPFIRPHDSEIHDPRFSYPNNDCIIMCPMC